MNDKDQKLFELLLSSSAGGLLVEYVRRSLGELCDLRNVSPKAGTKEHEVETAARLLAAKHLEALLVEPLTLSNEKKDNDNTQYL